MSTNESTANTVSKGCYALLSIESDAKTIKGTAYGYLTGILYLAPSTEADETRNLCPKATAECRKACLYGAGMAGVFPSIKKARIEKTKFFLYRSAEFVRVLENDIRTLVEMARRRGLKPAVRLNGTSDLPKLAQLLASRFPEVQFYDYTKIPRPWKRTMANYHLTFSHSGENLAECLEALAHGVNVAVVFTGSLPGTWNCYRVIDGDVSDLRFLDSKGVIGAQGKRYCPVDDGRRIHSNWKSGVKCAILAITANGASPNWSMDRTCCSRRSNPRTA